MATLTQPHLVVVIGAPGAGKTTVAKALASSLEGYDCYLAADPHHRHREVRGRHTR